MSLVDNLSGLFNAATVILVGAAVLTSPKAHALGDLILDGVTKNYVGNTGETTVLNSHIKTIRVIGELKLNNTHSEYVHEVGELIGVNSTVTKLDATGDIHLLKSEVGLIDTATMIVDLQSTTVKGDVIINRKWDKFFTSLSFSPKKIKPTIVHLKGSRIEGILNCVTACVIENNNSYIAQVEGNTNSQ